MNISLSKPFTNSYSSHPHMCVVRTMSVAYHLRSSRVSTSGRYLSFLTVAL